MSSQGNSQSPHGQASASVSPVSRIGEGSTAASDVSMGLVQTPSKERESSGRLNSTDSSKIIADVQQAQQTQDSSAYLKDEG